MDDYCVPLSLISYVNTPYFKIKEMISSVILNFVNMQHSVSSIEKPRNIPEGPSNLYSS